MKTCSKCNIDKLLSEFGKRHNAKDGKRSSCKLCDSKDKKLYYIKNKTQIITNVKTNRKNINEMTEKQKLKQRTRRLRYYYINISKDIFKLKISISNSIRHGFNVNKYKKPLKSEIILGCSFIEFKNHLELKWLPWMNWDNYGKYNGRESYGWDIDHIIPLSSAMTEADVIKLNHYTNLQPLCSYINRYVKKGKF